jgi:hypothetical protein
MDMYDVDRSNWKRSQAFTDDWQKAFLDATAKAIANGVDDAIIEQLSQLQKDFIDVSEARTIVYFDENNVLSGCSVDFMIWAIANADPTEYYKQYSSENPFRKPS